MSSKPAVLITGASSGIGAVYADRFAKRGHDLVLAARDYARMEVLAARLRTEHRVGIEIVKADLTNEADLASLEAHARDDTRIGILVNNAGMSLPGMFIDQTPEHLTELITLNATTVVRLAAAVVPRFTQVGTGAIINIASVVGLGPELGLTVYGATKAFVLFLSQGLQAELGPKGVYVQAVLPAATRTEIWERSGKDVNALSGVMEVDELVDAALVGFDRRESVTIPPLPDAAQWDTYEATRRAMLPNFVQAHAAARYRDAG